VTTTFTLRWSLSNRQFALLAFFVLEAIAIVVYLPAARGFFLAEDFLWLRLATAKSVLGSFSGTWGHGIAYRPIMRVSYYLDWLLYDRNPFGWHFTNIVLTGLDAFVLLIVLLRMKAGRALALTAALLFVVGPFGRENIDWISGRTGLLSLLFTLLATYAWLRGEIAMCVAFAITGLATYEAGIVLPGIIFLLTPIAARATIRTRRLLLRDVGIVAAATAVFWTFRWTVLRRVGGELDTMHASVAAAARENISGMIPIFRWCWSLRALVVLVGAVVVCSVIRKTRTTLLILAGLAFILYAPYFMLVGVALRFLFMMQLPLIVLMSLPLALVPHGRKRAAAAIALLIAVFPAFASRARANAREAASAGQLARRILDQAGAIAQADRTSNLVFACVPASWAGWPLLAGDFGIAVDDWFYLQQGRVWNQEDALRSELVLRRLRQTPSRVYHYRGDAFAEMPRGTNINDPTLCD